MACRSVGAKSKTVIISPKYGVPRATYLSIEWWLNASEVKKYLVKVERLTVETELKLEA